MQLYDEGGLLVSVAAIWSREVVGGFVVIATDALGCAARMAGSGGVGGVVVVDIFDQTPYERLYVNRNPTAAVKYVATATKLCRLGLPN